MANNKKRQLVHLTGVLVLAVAGLWAAGLAPLDAVGTDSGSTAAGPIPQLKTLSAKAGRRITTITIETSDPVPYLTNRPDPMTLLVDLREVDTARDGFFATFDGPARAIRRFVVIASDPPDPGGPGGTGAARTRSDSGLDTVDGSKRLQTA